MNFFKSRTNICFLSVIFLTVCALIFCCTVIYEKNSEISKLYSKTASSATELQKVQEKVSEMEKELDKITDSNSSLKEKLNKAEKENSSLIKERNSLKKQNSSLKNKVTGTASKTSKPSTSKTSSVPKGKRVCYLTFDDGPSDNTLKILNILDKYNVKATFFVIHTKKMNYVKKISEAGHTVGLHTYSHQYKQIYASQTAYFNDLKKISDEVKKLTGKESKVIRFPGGSSNRQAKRGFMTSLSKAVEKKGYSYFDWNVDSLDASGNNVSYTKIRDSVLTSAANKNSICVLMHDTEAKKSTVTALPKIIEGLKKQGYTFEALTTKSAGYHHTAS